MINNTFAKTAAACATSAALLLGAVTPALAQVGAVNTSIDTTVEVNAVGTGVNADVKANVSVRIGKAKERANQEIDRRVVALTELKARIESAERISASGKASMSATLTSQINSLSALKTEIAADADLESLKADIKSITQSYRIFALIVPQGHIAAMSDRMTTTADLMVSLGAKLKVKIDEAKTAGADVTALETALADLNAKVADARVQATAAVTLSSSLTPDQGDEAKLQANKKALADARVKLRAGSEALRTARQDAKTIVQELKSLGIETNASASASGSVNQ